MFETYSRRKALAAKTGADVYQYKTIPERVRIQAVHILRNVIGSGSAYSGHPQGNIWESVRDEMREDVGVFILPFTIKPSRLAISSQPNADEEVQRYFLECETDRALDVIELLCRCMEAFCSTYHYAGHQHAEEIVGNALKSLNRRFKEGSVGYQYENGCIVQVDSELLHKDAVKPALEVLRLPGFAGAQSEFLSAHEHYRHGRNSEALVDCHKSFESIMKAICTKRGWKFDPTKAASHLVEVCIANGLLQKYQQASLTGLRSLLESAIPTPRNKTAAHGAGVAPVSVPDELASYVIHLTASTLLFLANSERALP